MGAYNVGKEDLGWYSYIVLSKSPTFWTEVSLGLDQTISVNFSVFIVILQFMLGIDQTSSLNFIKSNFEVH